MISVLLLSVAVGSAADAPSPDAPQDAPTTSGSNLFATGLDLTDPWRRLAFARSLLGDGSSADEAAVALLRLTKHDLVGAKAREELYSLAIKEPIHAGWRDIYDTLLSAGDLTADGRLDLSIRSAAAAALDPATRARGLSSLQSIVSARPKRGDARVALGEALMSAGRADEARAVFQGTEPSAQSNRGAVLALIAGGRLDEAKEYATALAMDPRDPNVAAIGGPLRDRAEALTSARYLDAAEEMLTKQDGGRKDSAAWGVLADALLVDGDPKHAAAVLAKVVSAHPEDASLRRQWTAALLEAGDLDLAKNAAGTDETALQLVYAVQLVGGGGVANVLSRAEDIDRAARAAPGQPEVVRQQVELLLAQGKPDAARTALAPVVASRPHHPGLAQLFDRVALATDHPTEAVAARRLALVDATASSFWPRLGSLAGLHTMVAEHVKQAKRYDQGLYHYQVAIALLPDAAAYYSGIGGMLWSAGRLDEGRSAYLAALKLAPNDVGALQSAVGISLASKDVDGAQKIVDKTQLRGPQISKLREDVEVARVLATITEALDSGMENDARAAFQDLLVRYPDNPRILHALGDTLLGAGKANEALSAYQRARALTPRDPWLAMAEATCRVQLGDYEAANEILDDLGDITDDETRKAMRTVRARAFRAQGEDLWHERAQSEAAFEAFAQALSLDAEPWSLVALGGLYLEHRQPGAGLACFEEALSLDPQNSPAFLGRINALQALGRLDEARSGLEAIGRRKAGADAWHVQEDMEVQLAITEVDKLLLRGDPKRAREVLDGIAAQHPDSPHVDAAMASLLMTQGQPGMALQRAERALARDPTHGRALAVALDAGMTLHEMDDVVKLFEAALDAGGGESARASLDNALFAASVQRAMDLASDGRRMDAQRELDELREGMNDNADHWSLLGGAYLTLNVTSAAKEVYDRALEIDPENTPAIIGMASTLEANGNVHGAAKILSDRFEETADPRVGVALAQIWGRLGRWKAGVDTLDAVRNGTGLDGAGSGWRHLEPYRLVALPSGRTIDDSPPASYEGLSGRVSLAALADLEEELTAVHYPYGDVGGGFFGRTGQPGENLLNSGFGGATLDDVHLGPLRLHLDVLSVVLNNGEQSEVGAGGSFGIASPGQRRITLDARLGTTPIGFTNLPYFTWLGTLRFAIDPHVTIAADTGRVPVTDSVLSWAGSTDDDGPFGQASFTWGGGWVSFVNPNLTDGGARFRTGFVEALAMDAVGRQEITAWVGQSLGTQVFQVRIGGNFTWLTHDRQIEEFVAGQAGVFSARSYIAGLFTGDLRWTPTFSGTAICASGAIGVQRLDGEPKPPLFTPGSGPAYAIGAGLGFPISDDWRIGLDARTESTGTDWRQQSVLFRIGYLPPWTGRTTFARPSEIHGTGIGGMAVCR